MAAAQVTAVEAAELAAVQVVVVEAAEVAAVQVDADALRSALLLQKEGLMERDARLRAQAKALLTLEEEMQDLKGTVRVFCRVRPLGADEKPGGASPAPPSGAHASSSTEAMLVCTAAIVCVLPEPVWP